MKQCGLRKTLVVGALILASGCGAANQQGDEPVQPGPSGATGTLRLTAGQSERQLDLPPRLQWESNYGYCGEVSLISAGLYYGQYVSQYDARAIASPGISQSNPNSQLLLGVNDAAAAQALHLKVATYPQPRTPDARAFLTWVRQQVAAGAPVAVGIYMNQARFYGTSGPDAGDDEYDHIVPVTGVISSAPWTSDAYHGDDVLQFSDNGLWIERGAPPYGFSLTFDQLQKSRTEANRFAAPVYALANDADNYGLAVTGVMDDDGVTLPVRITTSTNAEPSIVDGSNDRPPPTALTLTVTVNGLEPEKTYRLYRYDDAAKVPNARFNAAAAAAVEAQTFRVQTGTSYTAEVQIMSNETAIFRAVPATAP